MWIDIQQLRDFYDCDLQLTFAQLMTWYEDIAWRQWLLRLDEERFVTNLAIRKCMFLSNILPNLGADKNIRQWCSTMYWSNMLSFDQQSSHNIDKSTFLMFPYYGNWYNRMSDFTSSVTAFPRWLQCVAWLILMSLLYKETSDKSVQINSDLGIWMQLP